jgi:hypothetical protein
MSTNKNWPFADARNSAVFTSRKIVFGGDWVYYVTHDENDGAWQFHPFSGITPEDEAVIVSLEEMVRTDESLKSLSDLPPGWHAWRQSAVADWERAPIG